MLTNTRAGGKCPHSYVEWTEGDATDDNGEMLLLSTIATNQLMSSRVLCVSTSAVAAAALSKAEDRGGVLNFCFSEYHHQQQLHIRGAIRGRRILPSLSFAGRPHADEM